MTNSSNIWGGRRRVAAIQSGVVPPLSKKDALVLPLTWRCGLNTMGGN